MGCEDEREVCGEVLQSNGAVCAVLDGQIPLPERAGGALLCCFCARGAACCLCIGSLQCGSFDT